ncbi:uncharacterized protein TM35_000251780 [Trypanosoma theileri]|uniref:C3H1-type domain-containing protein n=1 Tax=Trypanosoma theileri TaxID=67003 RepID=A0A1X0NQ85_9TRYP|nr:uncharacterized protein TM35_000251780 [Trypanosoma theileri]ORC86882.1 hypothetical protein TM35_000251780 [Trypanosoma theileri]
MTTTTNSPSSRVSTANSHSSGAVKINYVVEHAAPSAVCLVRKLQTSPYQPLSADQLQSVTAPNLLSLRPPPHVAHQAVMDFYFAMNGHCGVQCADPSALDLITVTTHPRNTAGSNSNSNSSGPSIHADGYTRDATGTPISGTRPYTNTNNSNIINNNNAADPAAKKFSSPEVSSSPPTMEGTMYGQQQQQNSTSSVLGTPILPPTATSSSEDYRLSQIRRNERHVNNAMYGKVCAFFNTREGCRRGPYCNFLHVGKGGTGGPITGNSNSNNNNNSSGNVGSIGGAVFPQFP